MPRCAVIANPTKISDGLRAALTSALDERGWEPPLWLETAEDDPGVAMARQALAERVDLVIAAGGDGTVRVVAGELAESGVPLALVPSGTGNLLARNLDLPLDDATAIEVALGGRTTTIDLIKVSTDTAEPTWSAVMVGCGLDAMIMENTDPKLKSAIGSAAYFVSAAKQVGRLPVKIKVTVDGQHDFHRDAVICAVGNVSSLTGGLELLPGADPSDGLLNVLIATPKSKLDWLRLIARLLLRHRRPDHQLDRITGRSITVEIEDGDAYELDGDGAGECRRLQADVVPGALSVVVPIPVS